MFKAFIVKVLNLSFIIVLCFSFIINLSDYSCGEEVKNRYKKTVERYKIPEVILINQNGKRLRLKEIIDSNYVTMINFIYTTCTTICPVLSASFLALQNNLSSIEASNLRLISISIDPEHDAPEVMKRYMNRLKAKDGWDFFTGTREDIDKVLKAFNAYVPNKMSHYPLTLLHVPKAEKWIRLNGLISGNELLNEYRELLEMERSKQLHSKENMR